MPSQRTRDGTLLRILLWASVAAKRQHPTAISHPPAFPPLFPRSQPASTSHSFHQGFSLGCYGATSALWHVLQLLRGWPVRSPSAPPHYVRIYFILRKARRKRRERETHCASLYFFFFVDFFKYLHSSLMSPWRVVTYNQSLQMPLGPAQLQRVGETITITTGHYLPG